jgi:hypothetical protein
MGLSPDNVVRYGDNIALLRAAIVQKIPDLHGRGSDHRHIFHADNGDRNVLR